MACHCATCSKCVISKNEYSFLSQQSEMSVGMTAGFLFSNLISELLWDSESEKTWGIDIIFYLGKRILRIFR